jgi:hypothetical protein
VLDRLSRDLWCGRRNYALLLTMYNFGARVARVSEISGLRQSHVTLGAKSYVQLHRKGRKDRSIHPGAPSDPNKAKNRAGAPRSYGPAIPHVTRQLTEFNFPIAPCCPRKTGAFFVWSGELAQVENS